MLSKHLRERQKNWLPKTGDCLIQVNLHLNELRDLKIWPLNIGNCFIHVVFKTGFTVHANSSMCFKV